MLFRTMNGSSSLRTRTLLTSAMVTLIALLALILAFFPASAIATGVSDGNEGEIYAPMGHEPSVLSANGDEDEYQEPDPDEDGDINGSSEPQDGSNISIYFIPHQDDEYLTFSPAILEEIEQGREVHVVLCTDGSNSFVRQALNNGKYCEICSGYHNYDITVWQFVNSRDAEFLSSCRALGIPDENIHIYGYNGSALRYGDCELTVSRCEILIRHYLELYPGASVRTFSPLPGTDILHQDHYYLGLAAFELLSSGEIEDLRLFVQSHIYEQYLEEGLPELPGIDVYELSESSVEAFENSRAQYMLFDPDSVRFAIGEHSVSSDFNTPEISAVAHWYEPTATDSVRYGGQTRYQTMRDAVLSEWDSSDVIILASGKDYPDALASAALAGCYGAPIVLTGTGALTAEARECIEILSPSKVIIVGGDQAISTEAELEVSDMGGVEVERIAGQTRYETASKIAEEVNRLSGKSGEASEVILSSGTSPYDALTISSYSYATCTPVLLSNGVSLDTSTKSALSSGEYTSMIVVGGEAAVPDSVVSQSGIESYIRLGGEDRYETSAIIADYLLSQGMTLQGFGLAYGGNFPDALVAGPIVGKDNAIILLVRDPLSQSLDAFKVLSSNGRDFSDQLPLWCRAFGGENVISDDLIRASLLCTLQWIPE